MDGQGRVGGGGQVLTQALPEAQPPSGSPGTAGITSYLFKITSPSGYVGRNRPKALKLNSTLSLFHKLVLSKRRSKVNLLEKHFIISYNQSVHGKVGS